MTWNAGAATPSDLRHKASESSFFHEVIQSEGMPDLLVFGFQELVDLEDKTLTASMHIPSQLEALFNLLQNHYSKPIKGRIMPHRST